MTSLRLETFAMLLVLVASTVLSAADWKPKQGPLMTRWAKDVSPEKTLPEYPRPTMTRNDWKNLNGLWQLTDAKAGETPPTGKDLPETILVPFPIESALSGVMRSAERVWYRRTFEVPAAWGDRRTLLHFGAVDWQTQVYVNGKQVGEHTGGYDGFSFDITEALNKSGPQELIVGVYDPSDKNWQPRGKQVNRPHGIWYTPSTGIWETVWLEPVPKTYIASLDITANLDAGTVSVKVNVPNAGAQHTISLAASLPNGKAVQVGGKANTELVLKLEKVEPWSPESPTLYDLAVTLGDDKATVDLVNSYFGMRKISLGKDDKGITRILLNNKPYFMFGPLDQGFWPDGLYTAVTEAALKYDIEMTKKLGFNTARKHVKVEPERWYYWCDKLGLIVWQDMPNGDRNIGPNDPDITRTPESAANFEKEWKAIMHDRRNHPCIVMWVPFNEGWGQFDTNRLLEFTKKLDPTRLVDGPSGWTDRGAGDTHDMHNYPGPGMFPPEENRASVLGEYGGLGLPLEGHTWQKKDNWGYVSYKNQEELTSAYERMTNRLPPLIGRGLSAAIYTQTTDVEIEVNGLLTYDRERVKPDLERTAAANNKVYLPPPEIKTLVPTAQTDPVDWRYTTEKPSDGWEKPSFDDSAWQKAPAGFGEKTTPGSVVRTPWKSDDIWIRRSFELPAGKFENAQLMMHHDEDAAVYINGVLAVKVGGFSSEYELTPISKEAAAALKEGANTLAVHCHQTRGGQYIDVGLVDVVPAKEK